MLPVHKPRLRCTACRRRDALVRRPWQSERFAVLPFQTVPHRHHVRQFVEGHLFLDIGRQLRLALLADIFAIYPDRFYQLPGGRLVERRAALKQDALQRLSAIGALMKENIAAPVFFMPGLLCFFLAAEVHYVVGLVVTGQRHHTDNKGWWSIFPTGPSRNAAEGQEAGLPGTEITPGGRLPPWPSFDVRASTIAFPSLRLDLVSALVKSRSTSLSKW